MAETSANDAFVAFDRVQKSYDGETLVVKDLNLADPQAVVAVDRDRKTVSVPCRVAPRRAPGCGFRRLEETVHLGHDVAQQGAQLDREDLAGRGL